MLDSNPPGRQQSQNQDQLGVSDWTTHDKKYPFLQEFSDLISKLSRPELIDLLTYQQKLFAKSLWEAENYGGSEEKCEKRLKELYGNKWYEVVDFDDHMTDIREYYEYVLRLDHRQQWNKYRESANISKETVLE
tara:strand:- start:1124 stop:1525 length:402 start_codon:yes stop_codon:yes gene_type:complete